MATGGRILHHLRRLLPDPRTTVLLVGYQAAGTRGRLLKDGARELKMLGTTVPVRARIAVSDTYSAHADRGEILRWLRGFRRPPDMTYIVHGEAAAAAALHEAITTELGWTGNRGRGRPAGGALSRPAHAAASRPSGGRVRMKAVPSPGRDSTSSVPL